MCCCWVDMIFNGKCKLLLKLRLLSIPSIIVVVVDLGTETIYHINCPMFIAYVYSILSKWHFYIYVGVTVPIDFIEWLEAPLLAHKRMKRKKWILVRSWSRSASEMSVRKSFIWKSVGTSIETHELIFACTKTWLYKHKSVYSTYILRMRKKWLTKLSWTNDQIDRRIEWYRKTHRAKARGKKTVTNNHVPLQLQIHRPFR